MSDTPKTDEAFNEAQKLSSFAHQRSFLYGQMQRLEEELARVNAASAQWEKLAKQRGEGEIKLLVEKADLEAKMAALREDKARLDWLAVQYQRERKSFSSASVATGGESWPDEITLMVHTEDGTVTFVEGTTFRKAIDTARKINS